MLTCVVYHLYFYAMDERTYIGIDNGTTGSLGIISKNIVEYYPIPIKKELSYTKKKQNITRIDIGKLKNLLKMPVFFAMIERPMINPTRFKASMSAMRSLEAVVIALEDLGIDYKYIDSKEWQGALLPKEAKGKELKVASSIVGARIYPKVIKTIKKQGDADGLLIAHYCKNIMI